MAGAEDKVVVLDPYSCLPKRNRKFASECKELYLANQGAEKVSKDISHFTSVEAIWFNGNRLSRIENLENNFRIQEVYIENNRLVSLSGLRPFKFLRVLLAGNNQLRNLDKQLGVLSRFAFLRKLELFGNPIAEEPDYRLRVIYHAPQVELFDQHAVKMQERAKAREVVPNLDKVTPNRPKPKERGPEHSVLERSCFSTAKEIRLRQQREEDMLLMSQTYKRKVDLTAGVPKRFLDKFRLDPTKNFLQDLARPTQLEKYEMRPLIEKRVGKPSLTRDEVTALCQDLASRGVDEVGRVLASADVLSRPARVAEASAGGSGVPAHVLDKLLDNPEASVPTAEVASWLLTLEWPHPDNQDNDRRIKKAFDDAKLAEKAGDAENLATCRSTVLRLTRGHSYVGRPTEGRASSETAGLKTSTSSATARHGISFVTTASGKVEGARGDVFKQSLLRPSRALDAIGRTVMAVTQEGRHTVIGER